MASVTTISSTALSLPSSISPSNPSLLFSLLLIQNPSTPFHRRFTNGELGFPSFLPFSAGPRKMTPKRLKPSSSKPSPRSIEAPRPLPKIKSVLNRLPANWKQSMQ
ncbi:hypothetical protein Sjap_018252 [Stephania japonica]|uniref:Uncharacterized protein n=1 Tax=Stephania japonica TaxID=461633 RepID=A0AAP0I7N0_9MAGN